MVLDPKDELVWIKVTEGNDDVILITKKGKSIRFSEQDVRPTGRDTRGVRGIKLKKDDFVVDVEAFTQKSRKPKDRRKKYFRDMLVVTEKGMGKRTPVEEYPLQRRGGQGVKAAQLTNRTGDLSAAMFVDQKTDEIILTSNHAQVIKLPLRNIPRLKRPTQGVILMRFAKTGDKVSAVTKIEK
jgi:DNA gyrase subunit A